MYTFRFGHELTILPPPLMALETPPKQLTIDMMNSEDKKDILINENIR